MTLEFSAEAQRKFAELAQRYPRKEAALLPILYLAQQEFGYLSSAVIDYVAKITQLPVARIYGVVTFYTMLNRNPIGRHHIQVCRTLPCALKGAAKITALLSSRLGIQVGETTADGKFTLSEVECLASCGTAPMMQINDDYYENLSEEGIAAIIQSLE
jgi:NADH-quinone oxidoreductase subunit E